MKNKSQIIDDIARLAGGAAGVAGSLQQQVRNDIQARVEEMATRLDLVPREDYDRLETLVTSLEERVTALENKKK